MKKAIAAAALLVMFACGAFAQKGTLTIYAVRHGQTILNLMDRAQGWSDGILTEKGVTGAVNMGKGLRNVNFAAVYSSDLGRAVNTARLAMEQNKATKKWSVKEMSELREVGFGYFEGGPNAAMFVAFAKEMKIPMPDNVTSTGQAVGPLMGRYSYPDLVIAMCDFGKSYDAKFNLAESSADVKARVKKGLAQIIAENPKGGNVMVVAHGLSIMFAFMEMGLDLSKMPPAGLENSSVTKIVYDYKTKTFSFDGTVGDMSYAEAGAKM
jgi:probable phosphoglycerate mutase